LREALHDELATIRCLTGVLRSLPLAHPHRDGYDIQRKQSLRLVQLYLSELHPGPIGGAE